jgi:hypothetical protein
MKNEKIATNQERMKALRLAEIQLTDKEDFNSCVSDMTRTASLELDEAKVVANAIRAKYLPNILRESGMGDGVKHMINLDEEAEETADFADDTEEDEDMELHHFDDEDDFEDDEIDDMGEADDDETMATIEIKVPAGKVDAAQQAVQEALDNLLGGENMDMDSDMDMDEDMDDMDDMEEDMDDMDSDDEFVDEDMDEDMDDMDDMDEDIDDMDDDMDMEDDDTEEDSEPEMHKTSKVNNMTKQALAARRAEREEILKRIASEEEHVSASAAFKYNEPMANVPGEVDYPSMKLQGENSLKGDNFDYSTQEVPTLNGDNLQFPDITKPVKLDGSGDGTYDYVLEVDELKNPSEGLDNEYFAVPTEMDAMPHKATVPTNRSASSNDPVISVQCTSCGTRTSMKESEMDTAECSNCAKMEKEASDKEAAKFDVRKVTPEPTDKFQMQTMANVEKARIKTAFSCSSKLALAGIIENNDVDSYAEQMLNDNLKADAMIRQTKLLLSAAQASGERIAAAAAERMSTRTASVKGISTSPAFSGSATVNNAALDIQAALKGTWSMPNIED